MLVTWIGKKYPPPPTAIPERCSQTKAKILQLATFVSDVSSSYQWNAELTQSIFCGSVLELVYQKSGILYWIYSSHLLFDHAVLCVGVFDVVAVEAGPVEHRLEVTQCDSSQRLTHACHEGGRRSRITKILYFRPGAWTKEL